MPPVARPVRRVVPTSKLTDANNLEKPELSFQRKAVHEFQTRQVQESHPPPELPGGASVDVSPTNVGVNSDGVEGSRKTPVADACHPQAIPSDKEPDECDVPVPVQKRKYIADNTDDDDRDDGNITQNPQKKTRASLGNPRQIDEHGFLADIQVQPIDKKKKCTRKDKTTDIEQFFHPAPNANQDIDLDGEPQKGRRGCKLCPRGTTIVDQATTLRRHMEAFHSGRYRKWAQDTNFESKLPGDVQKRKAAAEQVIRTLDRDLREKKPSERIVKYSDKAFHQAAIEWLVATDQPIQALNHPKFGEMIDLASRATSGVKIPGRKSTRATIIQMFKDHLAKLKAHLNGPTVAGEVSLTCDAWQASNVDGYFAVTGHWIDESVPTQWELRSALLGFTRLCNSHNGERLGQALFKIVDRVNITRKIGHVTCDNASNNSTMMQEFATHITAVNNRAYNSRNRKINCLAHVINLATQCLISTYSNSPHFDPKNPEAHEPTIRDEVGLVRAITVKVQSSSKRKETWRSIQTQAGVTQPVQLALDMKVRWSSTYVMLDVAERNQAHIDTFINELRWEETDTSKRDKIHALKMDRNEWANVTIFLSLLAHADNAQQAFSSEHVSTLHLSIPALEALHRAWSSRAARPKYARFATALNAACDKIDGYYEKTTNSSAYIMTMVLNPKEKMSHFKKHWSEELQDDVLRCLEEAFKERYLQQDNDVNRPKSSPKIVKKGVHVLLRELSDDSDEDDVTDRNHNTPDDPEQPWLRHFYEYINAVEQVPDGWSAIRWWGVNSSRYHPVWASLARDHLAIMSSSVSSERAFSQGGLTITKCRNRLKGDVVEALQCIKCAIRHDLLFREPAPSSLVEADLGNGGSGGDSSDGEASEAGWDEKFLGNESDNDIEIVLSS